MDEDEEDIFIECPDKEEQETEELVPFVEEQCECEEQVVEQVEEVQEQTQIDLVTATPTIEDDVFSPPIVSSTSCATPIFSATPDSTKISHLIRTISRVDSKQTFQTAVETVLTKIMTSSEDRMYIHDSFGILCSTMADTWKGLASCGTWAPLGVELFGQLLSEMWYVHETFDGQGGGDRVINWMIELLLKRGHAAHQIGRRPPKHLLLLHDTIIQTITCLNAVDVSRIPTQLLTAMDTDFVDSVIGWMVDEDCSEEMSQFCSRFLQTLRPFFITETTFCKTLIKQVLEDLECEAEFCLDNAKVHRIMLLTRAYASILELGCIEDKLFINELSERVIRIIVMILDTVYSESDEYDDDLSRLICAGNEVLSLSAGVDGPHTRTFVHHEIEAFRSGQWETLPYLQLFFTWEGICCWLEGALSTTHLSDDILTIATNLIEFVDEMSESREKVLLVQTLLRTRNIGLLQKVYAWHTGKLNLDGNLDSVQREMIPFVIAGLSDLAGNKTGSILTLYALQPSIFDLLLRLVEIEIQNLSRIRLILKLLKLHCSTHSHWVASLSLNANSEFSSESPAARFLPTLFSFWQFLLDAPNLTVSDKLWVLDWITELLVSATPHASVLYSSKPAFFHGLLRFVCISPGAQDKLELNSVEEKEMPPSPPTPTSEPNRITQLSPLNLSELQPKKCVRNQSSTHPWPYTAAAATILNLLMDRGSPYFEVPTLQSSVTSFCKDSLLQLGLNPTTIRPEIRPLLVQVLNNLPVLIIAVESQAQEDLPKYRNNKTNKVKQYHESTDEYDDDECSILSWTTRTSRVDSEQAQQDEDDSNNSYSEFLMHSEFNRFLYVLLCSSSDKDKQSDQINTSLLPLTHSLHFHVRAAVDFLLRIKLKTVLGKPTDLFALIQSIFKGDKGIITPWWKFDFMFLLEQGFTLWGLGSYLSNIELAEPVHQFFMMNSTPCSEWLKRTRTDLVNTALFCHQYEDAFYHAFSAGEEQSAKNEIALFHLKDEHGLRGKESWQQASWFYLHGDFEAAIKVLEISTSSSETEGNEWGNVELKKLIATRSKQLLELDMSSILTDTYQKSPYTPAPLDFLITSHNCKRKPPTILDEQLTLLQKMLVDGVSEADIQTKFMSLDLQEVDDQHNIDLWTLLKVADAIRFLPALPRSHKSFICTRLAQAMFEAGNTEWVQRFLTNIEIDLTTSISTTLPSACVDWYTETLPISRLAAQFLITKGNPTAAVSIYNTLLNSCPPTPNYTLTNVVDPSNQLYRNTKAQLDLHLEIGRSLGSHPDHLTNIIKSDITLDNDDDTFRSATPLIHYLHKVLESYPSHSDVWLEIGNAFYELQLAEKSVRNPILKAKALHAYVNHLRHAPTTPIPIKKDATLIKIISRVISLVKEDNEGAKACKLDEIFKSQRWLDFLPEVAQVPILRTHMLERFPKSTAMFLWPHDSTRADGQASVACMGRKGLFDPASSILVDVNEEPYTPLSTLISPPCCRKEPGANGVLHHYSRTSLKISEKIHILGKELLRLGTSSEETWSWTLQRVLSDWNKRISSLKKDMTRDPDPAKIAAYINPIITFLQEMWRHTVATSESPAQFSFVVRNCDVIPSLLTSLRSCSSVDAVLKGFEKLLFHAETFDNFISLKSQLGQLSPKLASFKDWDDSLTLLGFPLNVSIVSIHSTVYALPTKTKPKKVRFFASNGKTYEYLVKGNENLNVDAGMMQFLNLSQSILQQPVWTYAVTPLGNRGGLIQMVERATPVFQLYKRYLTKILPGERTSEIFWKRMASFGIEDRSRTAVDSSTLRKVFLSLVQDSPKDLISRELLLASPNAREWYHRVKGFTRDSGVSASICYLLGIGDRHLDNILVDVDEGKLVHVDFSLVFGRGEKLRIPEVVPFRLTQNFEGALQYPGVNGPFSSYMEDTLDTFQKNEELTTFCARNIAFACQIEEDFIINPTPLRTTEVNSALTILKLRYPSILKSIQAQRLEILSASSSLAEKEAALHEATQLVSVHSSAVEQLAIALSHIKNAECDSHMLHTLHDSILARYNVMDTDISSLSPRDALLLHLTGQLGDVCNVNDCSLWASGVEGLLSRDLQTEMKLKFNAVNKVATLKKELVGNVQRPINKMRRLISNLDPLLVFIANQVKGDEENYELDSRKWGGFKALVEDKWIEEIAHVWLHARPEEIASLTGDALAIATDLVELTLEEIFHCIQDGDVTEFDLAVVDGNLEYMGVIGIDNLVEKVNEKLDGFNVTNSVELLIQDANIDTNLCKMFEGWTPWI